MSTKLLEKTILKKIDELIEIIIGLSKKEEGFEVLYQKSIEKTEEIIPLILHFINGNTSLVVPMLHQLIMEKLPDPRIISSFGNLQEEINLFMNKVKQNFDLGDDENVTVMLEPGLYSSVLKAFPNCKIFSNYRLGGRIVEIYIPDLNMVLESEKTKTSYLNLKFCEQHNLKLFQIPNEVALDYRKLLRFIRQKQIN